MPAKYGVNYSISAEAARPISVQSITPLAIIGTAEGLDIGLHFFGSVAKAKDALAGLTGSLKQSISAVYDQAVETPVILSVFEDDGAYLSEAIKATERLSKAEAETGYRPNIIIAPCYSNTPEIAAKMQTQAERLKATAIIDLGSDNESDAIIKAQAYGTKRVVLCDSPVMTWDVDENKAMAMPLSAYVAAMICRTDAEREYGFSDSYSNRTLSGITGVERPIEFVLGEDCEADRYRAAGITTVIRYDGFRLWGGETTDPDTIWVDLARVRTFDRIAEACQKGVFFAIDRKANELYYAKRSVEELCRGLTGSQVLIGYSVSWNAEKNTTATVTEGKFYLDIKMQNNPIVKTLELDFAYVDTYSDKLLADINN